LNIFIEEKNFRKHWSYRKKKKEEEEHNPLIFGGLLMAYSCGLYLNKKRVSKEWTILFKWYF
jgi:hypothetical protein